jgi:hypothetical protein
MWLMVSTFIVFPGAMDTTNYDFLAGVSNELSWFYLLNSTIFNVFQTIGRKTGGSQRFQCSNKKIVGISISRIYFFASFLLIAF